jgi:hypothetical protein
MLKAVLISIAALTAVDAAAWQGRYRTQVIHSLGEAVGNVASQDWSSGPLV